MRGQFQASKQHVERQFSDLHSNVYGLKEKLGQHADQSAAVTRDDFNETMAYMLGQITHVRGHVQELRKLTNSIPHLQQELKAMNAHVHDVRERGNPCESQHEFQEVQRSMHEHVIVSDLRQIAERLCEPFKVERGDENMANVASLGNQIQELRREITI